MQGGEGIRTYSESERTNRTVLRSAEGPEGLAFNWANGKLYYTGANKIYSVDEDGTNVRTVFESKQCELTRSQVTMLIFRAGFSDFEFFAFLIF